MTTWRDTEVVQPDGKKTYKGIDAHKVQTAAALQKLGKGLRFWYNTIDILLTDEGRAELAKNPAWLTTIDALESVTAEQLTDKAAINALYKQADEAVSFADKTLRPDKDKSFSKADLRGLLRIVATERDDLLFVLERVSYFAAQLHWLDSHFPEGSYRDVEGLCRLASREDIAAQQYSLNPGRYVGVALEDDGMTADEFREFVEAQTETLATLHTEADQLQQLIAADVKLLFLDVNVAEEV